MGRDLVAIFADVSVIKHFTPSRWSVLIAQAYKHQLLSKLAHHIMVHDAISSVPASLQWHLTAVINREQAHRKAAQREIEALLKALSFIGMPLVLLKGAAYDVANDNAGIGRIYNDIDILVDRSELSSLMEALMWHGWVYSSDDEYDRRYYHRWMHELPPMHHTGRGTGLDVHHQLLPITSRKFFDATHLEVESIRWQNAEVRVLTPAGRLLHSIAHMFLEGESEQWLRDLTDMHALLWQHFDNARAQCQLLDLANRTGLQPQVEVALYTLQRLGFGIPDGLMAESLKKQYGVMQRLVGNLYINAMGLDNLYAAGLKYHLSRLILFLRGHYLKMPLHILVPHLFHKAVIKPYREWRENKAKNNEKPLVG